MTRGVSPIALKRNIRQFAGEIFFLFNFRWLKEILNKTKYLANILLFKPAVRTCVKGWLQECLVTRLFCRTVNPREELNQMKKRYLILIALILVCAVAYARFGPAENFYPAGQNEFVKKSKRSARGTVGSSDILTGQPEAELAYAIVVMPKSYLPALKRFSRSRMARELKILPAKIEWKEGQLMAVPKQAVSKAGDSRTPPAEKAGPGSGAVRPTEAKSVLRNAAFLLLLQGTVSGNLKYRRGRSFSSAASSLPH